MHRIRNTEFFMFTFIILLTHSLTCAEISPPSNPNTNPASADTFVYQNEGRHDPFKPFLSKKSTTGTLQDPNEILEDKTPLTGMRLFEPGQLILAGIISTSLGPLALVEDQTKKGYIIKLGNLIGRRGIVSSIGSNEVVITEIAHTRSGKEIKSTTTMKMKNEGDK